MRTAPTARAPAGRAPGKEEVGHIRAGDEQQEQHGEARYRSSDPESLVKDVVLQSQDPGPVPGIRLRILPGELGRDALCLVRGLSLCESVIHACQHADVVAVAGLLARDGEGHPDVVEDGLEPEVGRHDPDDRVGLSVKQDVGTEEVRIGSEAAVA